MYMNQWELVGIIFTVYIIRIYMVTLAKTQEKN